MSKAVNSPTARLLQSSRLFSLPRPLPSPDLSSAVSGNYKSSDTATTPYPTHQAIATPASSLYRGDWGLKRSLPGRKLRGSKPTVRVRAQDTWEHVTTFESAGDHVRTLEKWNEMGIPMIMRDDAGAKGPGRKYAQNRPVSVYDEGVDITDKDAAAAIWGGESRWKFDGPWLSGMQEGEFKNWLFRQVSTRQVEWKEFLRQQMISRRAREKIIEARDAGTPLSAKETQNLRITCRPTNDELQEFQKQLRDDHAKHRLSSDLTALITRFLDLPPMLTEKEEQDDGYGSNFIQTLSAGLSTERGPPSTHPGAGLSHLRTNAIMENHPIHGPQASRSPVQARVVRPRTMAGASTERVAKLGVGGVVAQDSTGTRSDRSRFAPRSADDVAHALNPDIVGGGKVWVQPNSAWVDEQGRVVLSVRREDPEAIAVRTGDVEHIHEMKRRGVLGPSVSDFKGDRTANYGTQLPDRQRMVRQGQDFEGGEARETLRPRVEGFDKELGGRGSAGSVAELLRKGI